MVEPNPVQKEATDNIQLQSRVSGVSSEHTEKKKDENSIFHESDREENSGSSRSNKTPKNKDMNLQDIAIDEEVKGEVGGTNNISPASQASASQYKPIGERLSQGGEDGAMIPAAGEA